MIHLLISRECDYAIRILRDLSDGELHVVRDLCERELVPHKFAYKIIHKLSKAGLVSATRGVGGGVRLSADLEACTFYDLLKIIDPEKRINICTSPEYNCEWRTKNDRYCSVHLHLLMLEREIREILKGVSLQSLLVDDVDWKNINSKQKKPIVSNP